MSMVKVFGVTRTDIEYELLYLGEYSKYLLPERCMLGSVTRVRRDTEVCGTIQFGDHEELKKVTGLKHKDVPIKHDAYVYIHLPI